MWENFGGWSVVFVGLGFGWWAKFEFIVLGGKFEFSGEGEVGVGGLGICFLGVGSPLGEGLRGLGLWEWISGVEGFGVRGSGLGFWSFLKFIRENSNIFLVCSPIIFDVASMETF